MDKDTRALTLYNPKNNEKSFRKLKAFLNRKLYEASLKKRKELFLFISLYIVFQFLGACLSIKDNSVFINSDSFVFKRILPILAFNAVFSFTVFGKFISSASVVLMGLNFGIEFYLTEFATQGGKLGSIPKLCILLIIAFIVLLFLLKLFCFSERAAYGKQRLFEIKPFVVHILFICFSIFWIYFLFYLYYNI